MAFPSSPTDGQIYKDKIYNSTVLAWQDYNAVAPVALEPSLGTLHHFPLTNTTTRYITRTFPTVGAWSAAIDWSSYIPVGTRAVLMSVVISANATIAGNFEAELPFSDNNSTTPSGITAHPYASIGEYSAIGGGNHFSFIELVVPVSSSRTCYAYCLSSANISASSFAMVLKGYYI